MSFVGLHTHSDYSLLDGASQLPDLVARAIELGMPAIALTDHGVMYGAIELIKVCRTTTVKPIVGNEMYVVNGDIKKTEKGKKKYHQVVLAKNTQGYKNLVKLTTISHLEGMQGKGIFSRPCINKELIEKYHEGLIVTSGCRAGEVPQAILKGDLDEARNVAKWYKKIFGDDYYLEIQDHGYIEDRIVNVEIIKIAKKLGIKVIATNDSHFTACSDVEAHDALLCIQTGQLITEEKRMRYSGTEYLKSATEMAQLFRDHLPDDVIQEAINNTLEVAEKVKSYDIFGEPRLPDYPVPPDYTADTFVVKIAREGLQERFHCRSYAEVDKIYKERLDYELKMIERMGFSTYFLVVWDYIKYARDNNIPVGPGRGSAAGSLVAYAMRITNIDPVHHGLLFERFLNPERKSMPDIDTDFCIERRDDVIKYVTEKYGTERVAQIITFNRLTSKSVLKDVARVLNIPYSESDKMAKLIPVVRGKPTKLKVMISDETPAPEFKEKYDNDETVRHWLDMAMRIEGTNKTYGVHAAGVVISSQPLDEIVPLQKNTEGSVISQYFMEDLESLGLLKMDFLGLRNLTIIQNTLNLIKETQKRVINPDEVTAEERRAYHILSKGELNKRPKDVDKTYNKLEAGDLDGIFQLESSGMLDVVEKLKPSSIEDISSILALYRPGPLDAGLIPKFIDRKHGREKIEYEHPLLESILKETYGILVYQEQIMRIAQDLAGYSLGQADLLRRCLSGNTEIIDAATGSLVTLGEIANKPEYWLGRKVFSLDLKTQNIIQKPITEIHKNGVRDVWEIQTKTNRRITATDDHLFYTVLGWKPLKSFKSGSRIGLSKTIPINHNSNISDAQIKLTAYLIGDGHLSTKHSANSYFCNSDREMINDFNRCAEALFGLSAPLDEQKPPSRSLARHRVSNFATAFQDEKLKIIAESEVFWDEIVDIKYVGKQKVFDLSIAETHNFIANDFIAHNCMGKKKADEMEKQRQNFIEGSTKNGIKSKVAEELFGQMVKFAEYCFNKSHSTAYAYVTYQTAFLKANYPVEYMAALLTANSGDQEKVAKYLNNCDKTLNIEIEPPNINRSGVNFTPLPGKILFGLSAVKNVGESAIEAILLARKEGDDFKSLANLCERVNLHTVNSRSLESLIKAGAFDTLEKNRQQLIKDLELLIPWAQARAKDKEIGQGNLFDLLGVVDNNQNNANNTFESAPKAKPTKDFTRQEKQQFEKELLGLYVSDHPLKSLQKMAANLNPLPIELGQLAENKGKATVIVVLTEIKDVITKKGDKMAILKMEDLTGQVEAVVFPKTYEVVNSSLIKDTPLMLKGKIDRNDDRIQLIVEEASVIDLAQLQKTELTPPPTIEITPDTQLIENKITETKTNICVQIALNPQQINDNLLRQLAAILQEQSGDKDKAKIPVMAIVTAQNRREGVRFGQEFWVQNHQAAVDALSAAGFTAHFI